MSFKIAVIGCGWVSAECHGPAYQEYAASHAGCILGACCDVDPRRAEQFRGRFGFQRTYTDYLEMLDKEQPQAVALNVPPQLISAIGCDILQRGYPLITEKPPGLSLDELDRLIDAAHSSRTIHQVAFNRRFMPLMVELKQQLTGQSIFHLDVHMSRIQRMDASFATTAVHVIDSTHFLAGCDYAQATITYLELPYLGPGVANILLDGRFTSGATVHLAIFPVTGLNMERTTVYALDHTFFLQANNGPDAPGRLIHYQKGQAVSDLDGIQLTGRREDFFLNGFYHEDAAFFDAVQARRQPAHDFQSCRQSIEIMQCLMRRETRYESSL